VQSSRAKAIKMIRLGNIKTNDKIYDLGAGNGLLVNLAAAKGANSIGYEISIPLVIYYYFRKIFFHYKGSVRWGNFFNKDISDADIVFCYLLPHSTNKVGDKIYPQLKNGAKIVSNGFQIEGMKPITVEDGIYVYIKK
jgi:predicted RNA methylase